MPTALLCEGFHDADNNNECYFVDKNGYVFELAPQFPGNVYPTYYKSKKMTRGQPKTTKFILCTNRKKHRRVESHVTHNVAITENQTKHTLLEMSIVLTSISRISNLASFVSSSTRDKSINLTSRTTGGGPN